jgi:hypothetical protein
MVTVLIDVLLAFWVLAFGAMAIVPLVLGGKRHDQPVAAHADRATQAEDQVLSIQPIAPGHPSPIIDRLPTRRPARPAAEQRRAA